MKIVSTNIGERTTVVWRKKEVETGIFKKPIDQPIFLGKTDVKSDTVIDRKHHGGVYKACYLYSAHHYPYWKKKYANLDWHYGMFGENLTVDSFDETQLYVGNIYKVGNALVQISEPRQPCFKLGIRFNNAAVIKDFLEYPSPGTYIKVLEEGEVKVGDEFILQQEDTAKFTVQEYYELATNQTTAASIIKKALACTAVKPEKQEKYSQLLN